MKGDTHTVGRHVDHNGAKDEHRGSRHSEGGAHARIGHTWNEGRWGQNNQDGACGGKNGVVKDGEGDVATGGHNVFFSLSNTQERCTSLY